MSTLYFPQLATGALSQFPSRKDVLERTVINRTPGNCAVKMADPEAGHKRWDLSFSGLTGEEAGRLEDLFTACEGRLRTFVFLDPFGNLLRHTGDLANAVWESSMMTAPDVADPDGGAAAWRITNAAQAAQPFAQTVDAPGWYRYAFSVWVRSESADRVGLRIDNADGAISVSRPVSASWERVTITGELPGEAEDLRCSLEVPAASALDVYSPQLEAQSDASGYRRTTSLGGVYRARFDQDKFICNSYGPDNHSVRLQVVSVRGETS